MKRKTHASSEEIARRKLELSSKTKQATRHAEVLRDSARRAKAKVKAARKTYKQARKSARKAEKTAARLEEELKAFLKSAAKVIKKAAKAGRQVKGPARRDGVPKTEAAPAKPQAADVDKARPLTESPAGQTPTAPAAPVVPAV
jgi:chromosome segregation ATPase